MKIPFLILAALILFSTSAHGEDIVAILEEQFPEIEVKLDPVHGILTIEATPEEHKEIERILRVLDIPTPQISIEARFVELDVTELGEMEVDLRQLITVDGEIIQILRGEPQLPEVGIRLYDPDELIAVLRWLEEEGKAEVISAPRVTTLNNQEATIELLVTVPYVSEITRENIGTEAEPIWVETLHIGEEEKGVELKVTPSVTPGETLISLHIEPIVKTVEERLFLFPGVGAELAWPVMGERAATTQMIVESGETVVLGGMIDSRKEAEWGRVPLLGDIPILGHLFRFQDYEDKKTKLLIFLTPYILCPAGERIVAAR